MAFVSELGSEEANSYLAVAEAVELNQSLPVSGGIQEWLSLGETDQEKTLTAATLSIDPQNWKGTICNQSQSLAWPRIISYDGRLTYCESLPYDFKIAVAYTAAFMGEQGGYISVKEGGGASASENANALEGLSPQDLKGYDALSLGNGAISLKLSSPERMQTGVNFIPPFAADILAKYIIGTNSGLSVVRLRNASVGRLATPYLHMAAYRTGMTEVREDGLLYPIYGGWASFPSFSNA
jgi:hypothetical protein